MSNLVLYLARHGESVSNFKKIFIGRSEDPELTEKGIQQARSLAKSLQGKKISAIYASALARARQTAEIVAGELKLPVYPTKDLIEVDLGLLDGHDTADPAFFSVYENMVSNWELGYPQVCIREGESLIDVEIRLKRFLNAHIINSMREGPILLVGHAILWMCFIWAFCENRPSRINDGFMNKTHLSTITKNGRGFMLAKANLDHEEIKILEKSSKIFLD